MKVGLWSAGEFSIAQCKGVLRTLLHDLMHRYRNGFCELRHDLEPLVLHQLRRRRNPPHWIKLRKMLQPEHISPLGFTVFENGHG